MGWNALGRTGVRLPAQSRQNVSTGHISRGRRGERRPPARVNASRQKRAHGQVGDELPLHAVAPAAQHRVPSARRVDDHEPAEAASGAPTRPVLPASAKHARRAPGSSCPSQYPLISAPRQCAGGGQRRRRPGTCAATMQLLPSRCGRFGLVVTFGDGRRLPANGEARHIAEYRGIDDGLQCFEGVVFGDT